MSALAWLALVALAPGTGQTALAPETGREALLAREDRLERRERFRRAWMHAGLDGRERARAELARALPGRAARSAQPSLADLARARALLESTVRPDVLTQAAQALSVCAVPGAFEAEGGAFGARVQVELRSAWHAPLPAEGPLELHLAWLGPGGERLEATRRPLARGELEGVHAVSELGARAASVREAEREANAAREPGLVRGPMAHQAAAFLALIDEGCRPESDLTPDALWEQMLRWPKPPERSEPWPLHVLDEAAGAVWELAPAADDVVAAVLIVGSPSEPPQAQLAGLRGASWHAVAGRAGWTVLALETPFSPASVADVAAWLERERGIGRLVLVAVGESVDAVLVHAAGLENAGADRVALLTTLGTSANKRAVAPDPLGLPTLLVDAGAEIDGREHLRGSEVGRRKSFVLQRRVDPLLVVELELPWLVAAWLAEEPTAGAGASSEPGRAPR